MADKPLPAMQALINLTVKCSSQLDYDALLVLCDLLGFRWTPIVGAGGPEFKKPAIYVHIDRYGVLRVVNNVKYGRLVTVHEFVKQLIQPYTEKIPANVAICGKSYREYSAIMHLLEAHGYVWSNGDTPTVSWTTVCYDFSTWMRNWLVQTHEDKTITGSVGNSNTPSTTAALVLRVTISTFMANAMKERDAQAETAASQPAKTVSMAAKKVECAPPVDDKKATAPINQPKVLPLEQIQQNILPDFLPVSHKEDRTMRISVGSVSISVSGPMVFKSILITCILSAMAWLGFRVWNEYAFEANFTNYMKCAKECSDDARASRYADRALAYVEAQGMTSGRTDVLLDDGPISDLEEFYCDTVKAVEALKKAKGRDARGEIETPKPSIGITQFSSITTYPRNKPFFWWLTCTLVAGVFSGVAVCWNSGSSKDKNVTPVTSAVASVSKDVNAIMAA